MSWQSRVLACFMLFLAGCHRASENPFALLGELTEDPVYLFTRPEASGQERFEVRKAIIQRMDRARSEIVFWFYGLNDPEILLALRRASQRGVTLILTGSSDQQYSELRESGLSYRLRSRSGLQHAKLMLIDRREMIAGTGNFTRSGLMYNNNLFFISQIPYITATEILHSLENEDSAIDPISWRQNGASFRMLLSPVMGRTIQSELVQSILRAREVRFMIFSFTDSMIASAMLHSVRRGTSIQGIIESESRDALSPDDELHDIYGAAGAAPFFLYTDGNDHFYYSKDGTRHGGKLHHKTMIVDDRILTGSYNYSMSARDTNLETFFEIRDSEGIRQFHDEFERMRQGSVVIARPPQNDSGAAESASYKDGQICSDSDPVHIFRGHGAFFRGLLFRRGQCGPSTNSVGFQSSTTFDPGRSGDPFSGRGMIRYRDADIEEERKETGLPFFCQSPDCDPCLLGRCYHERIDRISFQGGWLHLRSVREVRRLFFFHRNGLEEIQITAQDDIFLQFPPSSISGAMLLFETQSGRHGIACAYSTPPASVMRILNALPWFYPGSFPQAPVCIRPD